jgi:glycosyltransferase involved in cell wall biosynthesis
MILRIQKLEKKNILNKNNSDKSYIFIAQVKVFNMVVMNPKKGKNKCIGVFTPPISAAGVIPLSNLMNILSAQCQHLYLITGNDGYNYFKNDARLIITGIDYKKKKNPFLRTFNFFYLQIRIAVALLKIVRRCDIWIFFLGGEIMVFPMFTAKLFNKKVFLLFGGSAVHIYKNRLALTWLKILTNINVRLCTKIILYSKNLIEEWNLEKWVNKIEFAHEHIIDTEKFRITKTYQERNNLVGYIGRLSKEKGIWNFILAIEIILKERQDIKFLIIGDGSLREKIEQYINQKKLYDFVIIFGWISHDDLPQYYNKLKLIVIPSFTEGLPNVMLESMACGTPILATSVGMIPILIRDCETGYILLDNSPVHIAKNIIKALDDPNLEKIAINTRRTVEKKFTLKNAVKEWKKILIGISK